MSFAFDANQGLIVVPARLIGPTREAVVRLALDTGATDSMVNWGILVYLGYNPASAPTQVQITTGSGVEFAPRITVETIEAARARAPTLPRSVSHVAPQCVN